MSPKSRLARYGLWSVGFSREQFAQLAAAGRVESQLQLPLANYRNLFKRLGFTDEDIAAPGSDRLVDALVAQGSIPQVAGRIDAHLAAGANQVSIQVVNDAPEVVDLVRELAAHLAK
jgi:hypothetical protein